MEASATKISLTNELLWEVLRLAWLDGLESGRSGGEVGRKELWSSFQDLVRAQTQHEELPVFKELH
jgi:hypothetical protein